MGVEVEGEGVSSDFAVATSKFTVAAATGNTVVAGTLGVTGGVTSLGAAASYTGTLTGGTTSPTAAIYYRKIGDVVTLEIPLFTVTSNATTMTITGMPAALFPVVRAKPFICTIENNGAGATIAVGQVEPAGTISIFKDVAGGAFTNSGVKGIFAISFSYTIN